MVAISYSTNTIVVLGAGIQGSCAALSLADRGRRVLLVDREDAPIKKASLWNEGKIHLGYLFANDRVAHTARRMIDGAAHFWPFLSRYIPAAELPDLVSSPFTYAVHADSLLGVEKIAGHFARVSSEIEDRNLSGGAYFGGSDIHAFRRLPDTEIEQYYNPEKVAAAFETREISIDTMIVAKALRACIDAHPLIEFVANQHVERVEDGSREKLRTILRDAGGREHALASDAVVNALWSDRLRIDAGRGAKPQSRHRFRHKLAIHTRNATFPAHLRSTTLMLGQFGDIVRFPTGRGYFSWYPHCLIGSSADVQPPDWDSLGDSAGKDEIMRNVLAELSAIAPVVGDTDFSGANIDVEGGTIFSWGAGDIDDLEDDVHKRFDIGVTSAGAYHTIDTGKYGMGPLFAEDVSVAIAGEATRSAQVAKVS